MSWPFLAGPIQPMSQCDLDQLWPDKRSGRRNKRMRRSAQGRSVVQRCEDVAGEASVHCDLPREGGEGDEYVVNENENPWHELE